MQCIPPVRVELSQVEYTGNAGPYEFLCFDDSNLPRMTHHFFRAGGLLSLVCS